MINAGKNLEKSVPLSEQQIWTNQWQKIYQWCDATNETQWSELNEKKRIHLRKSYLIADNTFI
jgi:hypothetical protein